jgi:hypothetical protein
LPPPSAAHEAYGDCGACGKPLDVPLPWRREHLVEVVDGEDQFALGRAEYAEVRHVHIATSVHKHSGRRQRRKVSRHHGRGSAQKCERRGQHAGVSDRHQLLNARAVLSLQNLDRICPIGVRCELRVRLPRYFAAERLAFGAAFSR